MTKPDPLNVPAWLDPYAITFDSRDGAWTHEIRFVLTPAGLKAWSLTTTPSGRSVGDPPPIDVDGAAVCAVIIRSLSRLLVPAANGKRRCRQEREQKREIAHEVLRLRSVAAFR